jgi:hypothetical protein
LDEYPLDPTCAEGVFCIAVLSVLYNSVVFLAMYDTFVICFTRCDLLLPAIITAVVRYCILFSPVRSTTIGLVTVVLASGIEELEVGTVLSVVALEVVVASSVEALEVVAAASVLALEVVTVEADADMAWASSVVAFVVMVVVEAGGGGSPTPVVEVFGFGCFDALGGIVACD